MRTVRLLRLARPTGRDEFARTGIAEGAAEADIDQIKASAQEAAALTRELLAISGQQVLQPRPLDFNALVTEAERQPEERSPEISASPICPAPRTAILRSSTAIVEV